MSITRRQTATVTFPWSELNFTTIEYRPVHTPIMKGEHDSVEVRTSEGTLFEWLPNGDVTRKTISGELTTWWAVPTMDHVVHREPEGMFSQFYADGRITMGRADGLSWFWGPQVIGNITEGTLVLIQCTCKYCDDDYQRERW